MPFLLSGGFIAHRSTQNELEADIIGVLLMAEAGFRPEAAISQLERMPKHRNIILGTMDPTDRNHVWKIIEYTRNKASYRDLHVKERIIELNKIIPVVNEFRKRTGEVEDLIADADDAEKRDLIAIMTRWRAFVTYGAARDPGDKRRLTQGSCSNRSSSSPGQW